MGIKITKNTLLLLSIYCVLVVPFDCVAFHDFFFLPEKVSLYKNASGYFHSGPLSSTLQFSLNKWRQVCRISP